MSSLPPPPPQILTNVQSAISLASHQHTFLLVAIEPNTESVFSSAAQSAVAHLILHQPSTHHSFVILRIEEGSNEANMFAQVYPLDNVPLLCILQMGNVLDTVRDVTSIHTRIHTLIQSEEPISTDPNTNPPLPTTTPNPLPTNPMSNDSVSFNHQVEPLDHALANRDLSSFSNTGLTRRINNRPIRASSKQDQAYLNSIRDQIARDRQNLSTSSVIPPPDPVHRPQPDSSVQESLLGQLHLVIRQFDGSVFRTALDASASIHDLAMHLHTYPDHSLVQSFPTRLEVYTSRDQVLCAGPDSSNTTALKDLALIQSATLVMRPLGTPEDSSTNKKWSVYSLLMAIVGLLQSGLMVLVRAWVRLGRSTSLDADVSPPAQSLDPEQVRSSRLKTLADLDRSRPTSSDTKDDDPLTFYNGNSTSHEQ